MREKSILRQLIDVLVSGLIEGTLCAARDAAVQQQDEVRECPRRIASFTPAAQDTARALKKFLYENVYSSPALDEGRVQSMAMMAELFAFFLDHPERLPENFRDMVAATPLHRVVCDYIAGMTDSFFYRTYKQELSRP